MELEQFRYLLDKELIMIDKYESVEEAFNNIGDYLHKKGYVTDEYVANLLKREKEHPTGMDLSVVGDYVPNIAIPHTESKYCNATKIVVVKLIKPLIFKEMINPTKEIPVKYLFMILNKAGEGQASFLSEIIEFATKKENMDKLEDSKDIESLYETLTK